MAVGGPWSPSLDGINPTDDPRVLINTAIRTTRALTGIDLSACTQWCVQSSTILLFSFSRDKSYSILPPVET